MHQQDLDQPIDSPKKALYPWVILVIVLLNSLFSSLFLYIGYRYLYSNELKRWEWDSGSFQYAHGSWHFPFIIHLNDIQLESPQWVWSEDTLEFHINPLAFLSPDRHFFTLNAHSPMVRLLKSPSAKSELLDSTEIQSTLQPIDIHLPTVPVPLKIMVHNGKLYQDDQMIFTAKYLRIKQDEINKYDFLGHALKYSSYEAERISLRVNYNLSDSIFASLHLTREEGDTLNLNVQLPKEQARALKGQISLVGQSDWFRQQKEFPHIAHLNLQGEGKWDWIDQSKSAQLQFSAEVMKDHYLGNTFPIYPGKLRGVAHLSDSIYSGQMEFKAQRGAQLKLQGGGTFKNSQWHLDLLKYDMNIGPHPFPADIHNGKIQLTDQGLQVRGFTRDQSEFFYEMAWQEPGKFNARVQLNPRETWANFWTQGKVKLQPGAVATTLFDGKTFAGKLHASTEDAYGMKADSVDIHYTLFADHIAFDSSLIEASQSSWNLKGEVHWNRKEKREHYQFEISNPAGQRAAIWGNYIGDFSLQASSIPLEKIPFKNPVLPTDLKGIFTGQWSTHFGKKRHGKAFVNLDLSYKDIPLDLMLRIEESGDSTHIPEMEIQSLQSTLYGNALLSGGLNNPHLTKLNLSTQGMSLSFAEAFLQIPLSGTLVGDLHYNKESAETHLSSNLHVDSLTLGSVSDPLLQWQRLKLKSTNDTLNIESRLKLGKYQQWDSEVGIQISRIFSDSLQWLAAIATDAGGVFWGKGSTGWTGNLSGSFNIEGPWMTPATGIQIEKSEVKGNVFMDRFDNAKSLHLNFDSSMAIVKTGDAFTNEIHFTSQIHEQKLDVNGKIFADSNTELLVEAQVDLASGLIPKLKAQSEDIYLNMGGGGRVRLKGLNVGYRNASETIEIPFSARWVEYENELKGLGNIHTVLKNPNGNFIQPLQKGPTNSRIQANAGVSKFLFLNSNYPSIGLSGLTEWASGVALNSWNSLRGQKANKAAVTGSRGGRSKPIDLDITLRDLGEDSIWAITNLYTVPLTLDLKVTGNTNEPLITGDVTSTDVGWLEVMEDVRFDLTNVRLEWDTQPIPNGELTVLSSKELPFCVNAEPDIAETCPVGMNAQGQLGNFRLIPEANCGTQGDLRPDQIFTGIFVGCLSEEGNSAEWGQLVNATLYRGGSALVKSAVNRVIKWLGTDRDLIKDLNFRLKNGDYEADSSSIYISTNIPGIASNNLNLNFERVWDTGSEADFEDYTKVSMSLNIYNSVQGSGFLADYIKTKQQHPQIWTTEIGLTSKNYFSQTAEGGTENSLESNVGISFERPFWNWCFAGMGECDE